MFYDKPECLNPSPYVDEYGTKSGIFIFKKYLNEDLLNKIESKLDREITENPTNLINWYSEKTIAHVEHIHEAWEAISELIGPEYVIHPVNSLLKLEPGDNEGMFNHVDSPGKEACHLLSQTDMWTTCCIIDYGVVGYLGDFEGGEIFYPRINPDGTLKENGREDGPCFEYKPERGDVVIHSAFQPYVHGVRPVTSGKRYAFSNFSLKAVDNPGTFYNYGTPEYLNQVGDKTPEKLQSWITPLVYNPQFSDEMIKKIKDSGLQGEELASTFFKDFKH